MYPPYLALANHDEPALPLIINHRYMDTAHHKEILSHIEVQFGPQWTTLRDQHNKELREARGRATQTHNSAAMLPAEAACYVAHAKALVGARARCIADAYTAFNEPAGQEAEAELALFSPRQ
jgi:hypothetical protein